MLGDKKPSACNEPETKDGISTIISTIPSSDISTGALTSATKRGSENCC